ncbi:beta-glucosidase [Lyngbya confervoides BDU141951]|uniref:beta-N-acetylhexosaminidase n=2 Tax=Lyngbya TaxID=28073 RepID=A0ABD4SZR1_9CYAN|nr:glycoside hydrolase family 3 N-terminal domain-containing protein [Lyngbya confervoides]MCM1981962.1 beta-glucosidase [Lyngbya confervoides BDU141951]
MVVRASGYLFDHQIRYPSWEPPAATLKHWLQDLGVGGVILLGASAGELALRTQELQDWAKIPLLLAADVEEGVGQRFSGASWFPPPMALGAIAQRDLAKAKFYARQMGSFTAQEALAIGLNWVIAPVVNVPHNPHNPVMNVQAFSDHPQIVADLATAYIQGAQQHRIITTAKHFPGHGDTVIESPLQLPELPHPRHRLFQVEIPPFQAAIAAQVDSIMSAHLRIPALDRIYPATLSDRILTRLLRQDLGFEGLIVTDALVMGAIAHPYGPNEAAVLAIEAGADLLMMPADPPGAIAALCDAVETGRIAAERIQASLERIWRTKQKITTFGADSALHPHAWEQQMPSPIDLEAIAQPQCLQVIRDLLRDSNQCRGQISRSAQPGRTVIVVDSLLECDFLHPQAPAVAHLQSQGYEVQMIDAHGLDLELEQDRQAAWPTILQLFVRGNSFCGSAGLQDSARHWFNQLLRRQCLEALVIYGSPDLLAEFFPQLPETLPYGFSYGQMPLAQQLVLEALLPPLASHDLTGN